MIAIFKIGGVLISIKGKGVAVKNIAIISAGLAVLTLVLLLPTKVTVCILFDKNHTPEDDAALLEYEGHERNR